MYTLKEAVDTASLIVPKVKSDLKSDVQQTGGVVVPFPKAT